MDSGDNSFVPLLTITSTALKVLLFMQYFGIFSYRSFKKSAKYIGSGGRAPVGENDGQEFIEMNEL